MHRGRVGWLFRGFLCMWNALLVFERWLKFKFSDTFHLVNACHVIFGPPKYSVPPDQIFQESWNIRSGETEYFRYCLKYLVPHQNICSPLPPISNHWRWYRQVLKVNGTSSSSALDLTHGLHHWLPAHSFDVYCICRMPEMVEGKKWGECTKCLRWYHTNKCLNISQKSLEGDWVCPKCLS